MKKRKILNNYDENFLNRHDYVSITTEISGETFYEIGNQITSDLAEAVAIMMRTTIKDETIWENEFDQTSIKQVCPEKCLYWLTGGYKEWRSPENFKKPWSECGIIFQEEFGLLIMKILKKSRNLKDIREGFKKYLNLPILYDFALSQDLSK